MHQNIKVFSQITRKSQETSNILLSKAAREKRPMQNQTSFIAVVVTLKLPVRAGIVAQWSNTRPWLHCCARILKQARVINRPQTIRLTQLCLSIHFRTSHAEQAAMIAHNWTASLTHTLFPC